MVSVNKSEIANEELQDVEVNNKSLKSLGTLPYGEKVCRPDTDALDQSERKGMPTFG